MFKRYYSLLVMDITLMFNKGITFNMGKNTIQVCLSDDDAELFKKAKQKYNMDKSALLKEIIHSWLFSNKLQLEDK